MLKREKREMERERSEMSTALTETRSENARLQKKVELQKETLEKHSK